MIKVAFTETIISELQSLQNFHPHPTVRCRALILNLKSQNIPHYTIAKIVDVCENTVRTCFKAYQESGIESVQIMNFNKPESRLKPFEAVINEYFEKTPPVTIAQACLEIEKLTGASIKNTQMRAYIKSIGVRHRKVNSVPAKADIEAQKKFHDQVLQPRLEQAKDGKRKVYFVDAAHFVLGAFLGYLVGREAGRPSFPPVPTHRALLRQWADDRSFTLFMI